MIKKNERIYIPLQHETKELLREVAASKNMSMSEYVRMKMLEGIKPNKVTYKIFSEEGNTKKTDMCGTRFTNSEFQEIRKRADAAKITISRYLALSALNKEITVIEGRAELKEIAHQLSKIGNNLNQLTILAHKGNIKNIELIELDDLKEVINKTWQSLNSLMEKTKRTRD